MGNLSTPKTVQTLQKALHAKAKAEAGYRFYALYDKITQVLLFTTAHVVKGQYGDRRLVGRGPVCGRCERRRATDTVGMHGLRDVFQGMSADIVEPNLDLVPDIVIGGAGD